jgi:hypothetical protein
MTLLRRKQDIGCARPSGGNVTGAVSVLHSKPHLCCSAGDFICYGKEQRCCYACVPSEEISLCHKPTSSSPVLSAPSVSADSSELSDEPPELEVVEIPPAASPPTTAPSARGSHYGPPSQPGFPSSAASAVPAVASTHGHISSGSPLHHTFSVTDRSP